MPGFANDAANNSIMWSDNVDFSGNVIPSRAITTNGQLLIGSTIAPNIQPGILISPDSSITIGYSSPNITLQAAAAIATTYVENTGSAVPAANILNIFGAVAAAGTNPVATTGSGNTVTTFVQRSQAIASTNANNIGLAAFNSAQFSVDGNGFVSLVFGGFTWNDVSGAFSPLKENGYFVTGTATGTLPAAPAQGDTIKFFVDHASQLLTIRASGTQLIRLGTLVSSAGGTATSTQQGDSVELVYRAADTTWQAVCGFSGTWVMA